MHTFFHGWRRKAGVVTLVLALGLMGLWLRGLATRDSLKTLLRGDVVIVMAFNGRIHLWALAPNRMLDARTDFTSDNIVSTADLESHRKMMIVWREWSQRNQGREWNIPIWSLVIPLTLLSAYLILWKPRKRDKEKTPQSTIS